MSSYRYNCGGPSINALNACGWNNAQSPYYNGPCPNAAGEYRWDDEECRGEARRPRRGCGCCPGGRPDRGDDVRVRGTFATPPLMNVIAGASIPLVACGPCHGIDAAGGAVQIEEAGVYYAAYTVTPPAGETLTTMLTPTLNGGILPAGSVEVDSAAAGALPVFSGQIIFCANSCDRFALTTSEALAAPASAAPLLNVELMRISE